MWLRLLTMSGAVALCLMGGLSTSASVMAAPAGPAECWVGWRPSQGSIGFTNAESNRTLMTIKLKWRAEDLTFRSCRARTAFELETFFGLSKGRHKLRNWELRSSDLPGVYRDSSQENGEATIGVGKMDDVVADRWYFAEVRFFGRLGDEEFFDVHASRGYRLSPCVGGLAVCVSGWRNDDKFGPAQRIRIFSGKPVDAGKKYSWKYPERATLNNKILRHPRDGDSSAVDGSGVRHWIPNGGVYRCLVDRGWRVVESFADLDQRWVINSFGEGPWAECNATTPALTPTPDPPAPASETAPADPAPSTPPAVPTPAPHPAPRTWAEQQGSLGANTFQNPYNASGMGPKVQPYQWVDVLCKVYAPQIVSANPDGYWYRIASPPWNGGYYAVANTFWNGDIPGQRPYTHNTDWSVPNC